MTDEIHGITGKPYSTPGVRKKIPDPHQRPRIDLDGGRRVKRSWKDTPVLKVQVGDVVSGVGRVTVVQEFIVMPDVTATAAEASTSQWRVQLTNVLGEQQYFNGHQRVYAFTPESNSNE